MKIVMDIKEEEAKGHNPNFYNNIIDCVKKTESEEDFVTVFENAYVEDVRYILPLIKEAVSTGKIYFKDASIFYKHSEDELSIIF